MVRKLEAYKNYFWDFFDAQTEKVQEKIDYTLEILQTMERVPSKFFKHLEDGIYEIRVKQGSNIYRIFSFFDDGKLVILLHGFQKKTQKTPRNEIERAKKLRNEYYENKEEQ